MPESSTNGSALPTPTDPWLLPLGDEEPCGPDLEYDPESLELADAAGKPETQFGPGTPADWSRVRELSESLFGRTRDLRVALWWGRAGLNLDGFSALPAVLALLHGLPERFWDDLHPRPDRDDSNALARLSVLGALDKRDSLLGDIRNARLSNDRRLDGLRVRDVEVALGKLKPRPDEAPRTQGEITGFLAGAPDVAAALHQQINASLASLKQLQKLMGERFTPDVVVDLAAVRGILASVKALLPIVIEDAPEAGSDAGGLGIAPPLRGGGVHSVDSRQDAIRAIDLVCAYLERCEPTNPAQLLLRRAARVIDKNFLQLVQELAPDAVKDISRIMGVDPRTLTDQN